MGVALLNLFIASTFFVFVRIPWRAWVGVVAVAAVGLIAVWAFALAPYQRSRILDVVDPARDPLASGYQAIQSRIAIGSGGLMGTGYMEGTQTQLRFLPTQHTDFAFSVLAEEWGFAGSVFVLLLYVTLMLWGLMVARNAKDGFGGMLAVGVVATLFWPAALNIAMVLGLAPGDRRPPPALLIRRLRPRVDPGRHRPADERVDAPLRLLAARGQPTACADSGLAGMGYASRYLRNRYTPTRTSKPRQAGTVQLGM